MKTLVILATVMAVSAAATANAKAPLGNSAGGPLKQGNYCWVDASPTGTGFWDACDSTSPVPRGKSQRGTPPISHYSGAAGGGGGGGGGNR